MFTGRLPDPLDPPQSMLRTVAMSFQRYGYRQIDKGRVPTPSTYADDVRPLLLRRSTCRRVDLYKKAGVFMAMAVYKNRKRTDKHAAICAIESLIKTRIKTTLPSNKCKGMTIITKSKSILDYGKHGCR